MEEFIMTQEAFDRLWARVQGAADTAAAPAQKRGEAAVLRGFLDETAQSLALERRQLCAQGCASGALRAICRETMGRLRRLRTAYFLLTGERYYPPETCPVRCGVLTDLRKDYLSARRRGEALAAAAEQAETDELKALYRELSAGEARHAEALRDLIGSLLG